jgi:tetratricopeptide (TPR) repeat protein
LKEYKAAIEEFEAAYRLKPDPVFLYNLGQAYRLADDPEQALHFYRAYLRERPGASNRKDVEERVGQLEEVIAAKKTAAQPPDHTLAPETTPAQPAPAVQPAPTATERVVVDARAGRTKRVAGIAAAGVGVASIGVAIGMSVLAKQASDKLTNGAAGSMYDLNLDRQGRTDQNAAIALYAVGGVAVAAGVVLYVLGWRDAHRPRAMALVPRPGAHAVGADALVRF